MRRNLVILLAPVLVLGLARHAPTPFALGQDGTPAPMTELAITLDAVDFAFEGPSEAPAGLVTVTMTNNGAEPHHAQFVRLNDGVTMEAFDGALQSGDPNAIAPLATFVGGPAVVGPGASSQVILRLEAGQYVALCFVPSPDGVPHLMKGMVFPFSVTGEDPGVPDPTADAEVTLLDYSFDLPERVAAGPQVWHVANQGAEPHELVIYKPAAGLTADDLIALLTASEASPGTEEGAAAEPPFTEVGGMQALASGQSGWVVLDLEPGEYVAVCYVPNPDGVPHLMLGMIQGFTVG
jgi:hypothetical protein